MRNFLHACAVIITSIPLGLFILFIGFCNLFVRDRQYEKDNVFYRFLLDSLTAWLLWYLGVRIHVEGRNAMPKDERFVLVSNHVSNFDPLITWCIFRKERMAFVSKSSNFKIPLVGRLIRRCCFLEIDRENPRNAIKTIDMAASLMQRDEVSIGVYPEGTRAKDGVMLPFHNSVFKIAHKANAPLVVCSLSGANRIHERAPWKITHIYLRVIEVIDKEEIKTMRTAEIGDRVKAEIQKSLENTEEKVA